MPPAPTPAPIPVNLPQDLVDKLDTAEADLETALGKDTVHDGAITTLATATTAEATAKDDSLAAHRQATSSANTALDALKVHFHLVPPLPAAA